MIRDIVAYVDDRPLSGRLAGLAAMLARGCDARLTAVHIAAVRMIPLYSDAGGAAVDLLDLLEREADDRAVKAKALFDAELERHGLTGEFRVDRMTGNHAAMVHARYADLVMVGQHDPDSGTSTFASLSVADLALAAGRPVLVVPHAGTFTTVGQRVIVAWNGSREATRAVHDALPLLRVAKSVSVFSIAAKAGEAPSARWPGADIAAHLARHGVTVTTRHTVADPVSVADALLNCASDDGADLIVMGAYGHSQLRELVLGGVTRDVLRMMTVPVLFSH
jgi:nucleotide-binding universal stress UspA family protein